MELYATKKQIIDFLREDAPEIGVSCLKVGFACDDEWWLVMASYDGLMADGNKKVVKLARNVDDLQYDYDWDWECFVDQSTDSVMGNETFLDGKESKAFLEFVAAAFLNEFKSYERLQRRWQSEPSLYFWNK